MEYGPSIMIRPIPRRRSSAVASHPLSLNKPYYLVTPFARSGLVRLRNYTVHRSKQFHSSSPPLLPLIVLTLSKPPWQTLRIGLTIVKLLFMTAQSLEVP
jgi:hypothetical protein